MQIHRFYTFYDFNNHNGYPPFKPLIQNRLKRRMEWLVKLHPNWDRNTWVNYFIKIIKDNSQSELEKRFAHWHLLAYLDQDRCYFIWRDFRKFPFYPIDSHELYDLSNNLLFQRDKFQKYIYKYDSQNLSGANLKTYILAILKNIFLEKLDLKSTWRVLCDVDISSIKKIDRALQKRREALENYGITEPYTSQYIFALKHFILVYKNNRVFHPNRKKGTKWPKPEWSDFVEVAKYYNAQRFLPVAPLQVAAGSEVTPETIQKWINICIKALQYSPRIMEISYNPKSYEQHNNETSNPWQLLEIEEEQTNILQQADSILREKIKIIEDSFEKFRTKIPQQFRQAVMPLCYPHSFAPLNQEKLGSQIGVHQGTVSRYISKYFEVPLLNQFKQFTNEKLNLESYLTIFLEKRFTNPRLSNLLDKILIEAISNLDNKSQKILKLRYSQNLNLADIAYLMSDRKEVESHEIKLILIDVKHKLKKEFLKKLDKWQVEYIKLWIKNYYQDLIQSVLLNSFKELNCVIQEIVQMRYCQKMDEGIIINFYPQLNPTQTIDEAKQHLQRSLLGWIEINFGIALVTEDRQILEIVEDWLSNNLIYLDLRKSKK